MHYGTAGAGTRVARRSPTRARKARVSAFVALGAAAVIALRATNTRGEPTPDIEIDEPTVDAEALPWAASEIA